jgi:outer membrane scaffolding protein for murein synthesis (MipA/OmpV family)
LRHLALTVSLLATTVTASEQWELSLGAATTAAPQYAGSDEHVYYLFPAVDAVYHLSRQSRFYAGSINGVGLETSEAGVTAGVAIGYRYGLYGADDFALDSEPASQLDGMTDPGSAATVRPYLKTNNPDWNLKLEYEKGLGDRNKGALARLQASYDYQLNARWFGKLALQASWADDVYLNDYFGISPQEARPAQRPFIAESGLYNYGVQAEFSVLLTAQDVLFFSAAIQEIAGDVAKSDLVLDELQPELTLAYIHYF